MYRKDKNPIANAPKDLLLFEVVNPLRIALNSCSNVFPFVLVQTQHSYCLFHRRRLSL